MRSINYSNVTIYLFCLLLIFSSCKKDDELYYVQLPEGEPATIQLDMSVANTVVQTRAFSSEEDEEKINNLIVYVFDSNGDISSSHFFGTTGADANVMSTTLELKTFSGNNKTIYGIANVGLGMMATDQETLLNIKTFDELSDIVSMLRYKTLGRGLSFLMSGAVRADAAAEPTKVNIAPNTNNGLQGTIHLKRLDAKVTFNIKTPEGAVKTDDGNKRISDIIFISDKWSVHNASRNVRILYDNTKPDRYAQEPSNYFDSKLENFEGVNNDPLRNKKFSFYILPSELAEKNVIPSSLTKNEQYSLRTKRDKTAILEPSPDGKQHFVNGEFTYANKYSPYVKFSGILNYKQETLIDGVYGNPTLFTAKVTYTILLGFSRDDANDYATKPNTFYTYNVTLTSAESIIVEATSSDEDFEPQSGVEGSVAETPEFYEFDSHFETRIIVFDKTNTVDRLGWYVSSPFDNSNYNPNDLTPTKPKDYKWIYFRLNSRDASNNYRNTFANYPGETEIYTYRDINVVPTGDAAIKKYNTKLLVDYIETGREKLIDIHHLAKILSASNATNEHGNGNTPLFDAGKIIKFTAFINEFYYDSNPLDGTTPTTLWKSFVNTKNRTIGLSRDTEKSPDGQSELVSADVEFSQMSIQSIYNVNSPSLESAWGTENIDSPETLPYLGKNIGDRSDNNGRHNALRGWGVNGENATNPNWGNYINSTDNSLQSDSEWVDYACMRHNRDINGNGKIDDNEVRWYLSAINQLSDMWIGENSLNLNSRLFRYRKASGSPYYIVQVPEDGAHSPWGEELYISSSKHTANNMHAILWSSEGSSVSSSKIETWMIATKFYYRCLRNLGGDNADDIAKVTSVVEDGDNIYTINLDNLDNSSIRDYKLAANEILPVHDERSIHNRPYVSFQVRPITPPVGNPRFYQILAQQKDLCPIGWRFPNQRELAIMVSKLPMSDWGDKNREFVASTKFSFSNQRPGFSVAEVTRPIIKMRLLGLTNNNLSARCVRDL